MADESAVAYGRVPAGTRLNDTYEIDELIAAGGMGEVYRGHLIETGDQVAVKLIRPELVGNEAALALFRKEASALHHLHHEAIIRYFVFAIDPALRRPYLAMEFVDGEPLSDFIRRKPLDVEQCLVLARRLAAGLASAHEIGIIHRDISADNVILPGGDVRRAKLIDFGIAKSTLSGATTVIGDGFAGKYNYASPEQLGLFGGVVTGQSDIYSLGLLMAEAVRGQPLDMGRSHADTVERRRAVPELDGVDARLAPLIRAMLQPVPADRPASMQAVRDWTEPVVAQGQRRGGRLREVEAVLSAPPHRRLRPVLAAVAAVLVLAGAGLAVMTWAPGLVPGLGSSDPFEDGPFERVPPGERAAAGQDGRQRQRVPSLEEMPQGVGTPSDDMAGIGSGPAPAGSASQDRPGPDGPKPDSARVDPVPTGPGSTGGMGTAPVNTTPAGGSGPSLVNTAPAGGPVPDDRPVSSPTVTSPSVTSPSVTLPSVTTPPVTPPPVTPPPVPTVPPTPAEFVRSYDGGACLFLAVRAVSDRRVEVEAFSASRPSVETFHAAFKRAYGFEPAVMFRPLAEPQCPAVAFLRAAAEAGDPSLRFDLASFSVSPGGRVEGTVLGVGTRSVSVLVVSDDGMVRQVPMRGQAGGAGLVSITAEPGPPGQRRPELALAVIAQRKPPALDFRGQVPAAGLFPALQRELAATAQPVAVLRQYFRVD